MIKTKIELLTTSQPIERDDVLNTYTKDGLYCVQRSRDVVEKFPVDQLFRVTEDYSEKPVYTL